MGKWIYNKKIKITFILLQALCAGILAYGLLNIGFWMEDSYNLGEMSKNYEETDLFFKQVDQILANKIAGQDNNALFEENGVYNGKNEIDIQAYGDADQAVKDLNTTYLVEDLLAFSENGGWQALHTAIQKATDGNSRQVAGELLDEQADTLETIKPVTGISLSECSRWYSDSGAFVLNMYMALDEVCSDLQERYVTYRTVQDESWSSEAPGNLKYCIENTSNGELYTNFDVTSYEEALNALAADDAFTPLYEGERSFNIMVTNPDRVLNQAAEQWFLEDRFVNTNEKVLLAIDLSYPVSDTLREYADYFSNRESIVSRAVVGSMISIVLLLITFGLLLYGAGWEEGKCTLTLKRIDRVPTEIAGGIYMILVILMLLLFAWKFPQPQEVMGRERLVLAVLASAAWMLFVAACTSFVRRFRTHTLWENSVTRIMIHTWKQVTNVRAASGQLLFFYIIFFALNSIFLLLFGKVGIFMVFVLDMAVLLYLLRDMAGKQSIWEGIHQISKGDLHYKIDTSTLQGETYAMANAVNDMGDGLLEAVDAIVKNERLKAELITNVSHDIKTPLTSIVNYVDLLKRENLPGERVQHYIEVLDQKSQRLRQLTEDLVEASKISSGNIELHMMKIQLQSMLNQAFGEFEERLEEKQLKTIWKLDKEPVCILADGRQFWRVLENLFGNICKYAQEGTNVFVWMTRKDENAEIVIENTSQEILTIEADELTGRFVRGDRSRNTEGSGLGLSIAQNLTELQQGTFQLEVEERQFRVTLTFPVLQEIPPSQESK